MSGSGGNERYCKCLIRTGYPSADMCEIKSTTACSSDSVCDATGSDLWLRSAGVHARGNEGWNEELHSDLQEHDKIGGHQQSLLVPTLDSHCSFHQ